jgi:N-acetyl sugar amidotransferase
MKILYFSRVFESTSFIGSQVAQVAETGKCYYACFDVDSPQAFLKPNIRIIKWSRGKESFAKRIRRKLELSDLYFNLYDENIARQITKTIAEVQPDIIHCQYGYDALIFLDNYYRPDLKFVITFRGFDASLLLILLKYREKLHDYLSRPNVYPIFVCHALMQNLEEKSIALNQLRAVIYSNTDTAYYTPSVPKARGGRIVFTQISNFREKKGHRYTLEAFERFAKLYPDIEFEVNFAGDLDEHGEKIVALARQSAVSKRIHFPGRVDPSQILALLERSDVFVHNSVTSSYNDQEGIPNAIMEAMAMQLPIVATLHSGICELIHNDEDVFLSHEKNIDEYVDAILKASRAGYSAKNRSRIVQAFSKEVFQKNILGFYQKVLDPVKISYQQCTQCVLDSNDDPAIFFDATGICNHCHAYRIKEFRYVRKGIEGEQHLNKIVAEIKAQGKGKPYDCILGLSGGVDSTYLAWIAAQMGLRPLAVHFDNGWNSELAVSNIEKIVTRLNIPLHTFVIDWEEFKDLQLSVLKASVVDIEMVTDHAIITKLYDLALTHGIGYVLSGTNIVTEAILPAHWIHSKKDHINIRNIHRQFGTIPLKTYPLFDSFRKLRVAWAGIQSVAFLDSLPYEKKTVKQFITEKLGWRDYGGKHYESIFTRFYQGYILPEKFGIDKRKAHLSNLICSRQITRDEALAELEQPAYPSQLFKKDYEFVLKKLNLSEEEFRKIMEMPAKRHSDYGIEPSFYDRYPLIKYIRPVYLLIKRFRGI